MTTYVKYQCSLCRRLKDIEEDNVRVMPNKCIITKGCQGILTILSKSSTTSPIIPEAGLQDWYARGTVKVAKAIEPPPHPINIVTSSAGALVIALKDAQNLPDFIDVEIVQQRAEEVSYQEFVFKPAALAAVLGKDVSGRILRFDELAIAEDRVIVRVNGIQAFPALTPNALTFNSPLPQGSLVSIRVLLEKQIIERRIRMLKNSLQTSGGFRGSWANIRTVNRYFYGTWSKWHVYSIDTLSTLGFGQIMIKNVGFDTEVMLLLAKKPYGGIDRCLDFIIDLDTVSSDFLMNRTLPASLVIDKAFINEIYPPLSLALNESFIEADKLSIASSAITVDLASDTNSLVSSKIIGPI